MKANTTKGTNHFRVSFSPTDNQLNEVENWLKVERNKTGGGFYCNWNIIKLMFQKDQIAIISQNSEVIGFATWWLTSDLTARIDIAEVKPVYREKGIGRKLIIELLNFLKEKNICAVDLQCSPPTSEPFWKKLAFKDFRDDSEIHGQNTSEDKNLYTILIPNLQTCLVNKTNETIELWNAEPYKTNDKTPPTYVWNIKFKNGTRKLLKPLIHPAHYEWRLRWRVKDSTIKDDKIKYFGKEIDFGKFMIIKELPI